MGPRVLELAEDSHLSVQLDLGSAMIAADEFPWRGCSRCRTYDFDRGRSVPEAWVQPLSYLRFPCLNLPSHDFEKVNLENVF